VIYKGIGATTEIDAHKMQISKEALEKAAHDINEGKYVPTVGIEHDLTILPIGKVYKASVDRFGEKDYALHIEQEIFENISSATINGENYIVLKSDVDERPFVLDKISNNKKLTIETDLVNFESIEKSKEYLDSLRAEYDINFEPIARKSVIPDPELVFELAQNSVKYLLIYLCSKQVVERVGDALVDAVLNEANKLYVLVKKAIKTGSKYLIPQNRPVTYVFKGSLNYIIELIIKTTNPDVAISALNKEKLKEAIEKIDSVKEQFPKMCRVQLIYNENQDKWEFNYLTTETGEVIGTEKAYSKSAKLMEIYLGKSAKVSIEQSSQLDTNL